MEWKEVKIGDLGQIITGKTPKTAIRENWGGKIPFLSPSDDMSNKTSPVTARTLTELGVAEVAKCLIPANSICVSCIGSDLGKVVKTDRELVTNQQINTIVPHSNIDSDFVYYLMCIVGKELNYISKTSTAVPIINKSTFSDWDIVIPREKEDQRHIASILSSLDRKIELNNKINADLEEMAQAIFKNWFVDFEPFKDGKFVDSELGMIPEGWKVGCLGDIAEITSGKRPPKKSKDKTKELFIPLIGASDIMGFTSDVLYERPILVIGRVGTHGVVQRFQEKCWPSDNTLVIESRYYNYVYQLLKGIDYSAINRGSTQPLITQTDVKNTDVIIAPENVLKEYESITSTLFSKHRANIKENSRLSTLRDTLLPRLMSGELEVPE